MGDEVLMKKLILLLSIFYINIYANMEQKQIVNKNFLIKEYQEMFQKIAQKRIGIDEDSIMSVKPPFVTVLKKKKKKDILKNDKKVFSKPTLVLEAIFNNKVMISGKWYKLYQKIGENRIVAIRNDYVIIKSPTKKLKLSLRTKNENIKIK